ncbi:MAG: energy-coupling factor transporter transmembrane protein EcfT [Lachnospiraceae bacterium]|nr:energy-coupling factor transporter transmembrane protein EcfT [Candidatus Colinaster equi]
MLRDITLGQYYPADSLLHKLDPRVKIVGTIIYIAILFVADNVWGYLLAAMALGVMIVMSKVPVRFIFKGMRAIIFLLMITVVFNVFLTPGRVLFQWKAIKITYEGLLIAGTMAIRLIFLIVGTSIMTLTTTPNQLTDALEALMSPFKKIKLPVHEVAMMMSIALRFIPILMEETDKIMKAQMARGAGFDSKRLTDRAKSLIPLLVPLFVSAFRRANDLAMAMEARCYRGGERTRMKPLQYCSRDYMSYAVLWIVLIGAIVIRVLLPAMV